MLCKQMVFRTGALALAAGVLAGCAAYDPYYGGDGVYYGKAYSGGYPYYDYDYGYPGYSRYSTHYSYYHYGHYPYRFGNSPHHHGGYRHGHGPRYPVTRPRDHDHDEDAVDEVRRISSPGIRVPRDTGSRWPRDIRHVKSEPRESGGDHSARDALGNRSARSPNPTRRVINSERNAPRPQPRPAPSSTRKPSAGGIDSPTKRELKRR